MGIKRSPHHHRYVVREGCRNCTLKKLLKREEGDEGSVNLVLRVPEHSWLEDGSGSSYSSAWEPSGPWAPAQRMMRAHYSLPARLMLAFACLKVSHPSAGTGMAFCSLACIPPSWSWVKHSPRRGLCLWVAVVGDAPSKSHQQSKSLMSQGGLWNATLAQGIPCMGWAAHTQERMLLAVHSPPGPLFPAWVMDPPLIPAMIQGWAAFLFLGATGLHHPFLAGLK